MLARWRGRNSGAFGLRVSGVEPNAQNRLGTRAETMKFNKHSSDAAAFLAKLSDAEQAQFLVRFSFELTIAARDTYEIGGTGVEKPDRLRLVNEVLHRALGQSEKCLRGEERRYSAEEMARILLHHDSEFLAAITKYAFDRSRGAAGHVR
jgi:hypothetical protein